MLAPRPFVGRRTAVAIAVLALVVTALPGSAGAQTAQQQRSEAQAKIAQLSSELDALASDRDGRAADVAASAAKVAEIEVVLNEALAAIQVQQETTDQVAGEVEDIRADVAGRQLAMNNRARASYMGTQPTMLSAILAGGDVTDVTLRSTMLDLVSGSATNDVEGLNVGRAHLEQQLDLLAIEQARLGELQDQQEALLGQAEEVLGRQQDSLAAVAARAAVVEGQREDLQDESDRLGAFIAAAQAKAAADAAAAQATAAAAQAPASSAPAAPVAAPATSIASGSGYIWPLCRRVTSEYGPRWGRMHAGIDIDGVTGDPIKAANNGVVISAGRSGAYGNLTLIDHGDGVVTAYAHQSRIDVSRGQSVQRGQVIGAVGATGRVTGDHLHYETRVNGRARNPRQFLTSGC